MTIESEAIDINRIARGQGLDGDTLTKQYKDHLSDFREWEQIAMIDALVFPENFGPRMSVDELCIGGEYYTCLTNRDAHGRKGCLAAFIKGTKNKVVSWALSIVPFPVRLEVKELTMDFANTMDWIGRSNFPQAVLVGDRFHAQKLVNEAVQEMRIKLKRDWIDIQNNELALAKKEKRRYREERHGNGETRLQLLSRSKHLLTQPESKWKDSQAERAKLLFTLYPELHTAYKLAMGFRDIYEGSQTKQEAEKHYHSWQRKVVESGLSVMRSMATNLDHHSAKILAFFPDRATNAGAESFNSKLKGFRSLLRGIRDMNFFLYRVCKLYA